MQGVRDTADGNPLADAQRAPTGVGTPGGGAGQDQAATAPAGGRSTEGSTPAPECVLAEGPLPAGASLEGRAGEYLLTMVEQGDPDGTPGGTSSGAPGSAPTRSVRGALVLFEQTDILRDFIGGAGDPVPGVTSPLYGSTDVDIEAVGAVQVGSLSSEDPASPGVLVIESETGASPSILLRLGADANRRNLVRFDGGYAVLTVVEVGEESFSGIWSSGVQGPDSEGFFCATLSR